MKKIYLVLLIIFALIIAGFLAYYFIRKPLSNTLNVVQTPSPTSVLSPLPSPTTKPTSGVFDEPVGDFAKRVTKKPFGIYVTPQDSPIQPERFTGYHTGADAEYTDATSDVPVFAIADGTVVLSKYASGYGGVFMISFDLNGTQHTALYGHIRPSSLPRVGIKFNKGDQLGLLGTGYSSETDGERRHLHFAILSDNSLNIKGYAQTKAELSGWIDPLTVL